MGTADGRNTLGTADGGSVLGTADGGNVLPVGTTVGDFVGSGIVTCHSPWVAASKVNKYG